jgi:hypothetical protein
MLHLQTAKKKVRRGNSFLHSLQTPWTSLRVQEANVVEQQRGSQKPEGEYQDDHQAQEAH